MFNCGLCTFLVTLVAARPCRAMIHLFPGNGLVSFQCIHLSTTPFKSNLYLDGAFELPFEKLQLFLKALHSN